MLGKMRFLKTFTRGRVSHRRHIRRVWDTLYINVSLSLLRQASRFSICGAMRRIFYLYIITHRPFSTLRLHLISLLSPLSFSLALSFSVRRFSFPFLVSLVFPTLLVFSHSPPVSPFPRPPASRHIVYLFYFIIKQTSSCHPRANMRLYTYTGSTSNTVSTWREDRLTRPFQTRKIFFSNSPLRSRYHSPFTYTQALSESVERLSRLLKGFHLEGILCALEAQLKTYERQETRASYNECSWNAYIT